MKPTLQQGEILKEYLSDILKYRETIDEVYDHILSAVEEKPEKERFQNTVNNILNHDFGGGKGLMELERSHQKNSLSELSHQLLNYIKANFKFPNILSTFLIFFACYYFTIHVNIIGNPTLILAFPLAATLLFAINWVRTFFIGFYTGDKRKSLRDINIVKIISPCYRMVFIFCCLIPLKLKFYEIIIVEYPVIFTTLLTGYLLYFLAVIKIIIDEFKLYVAK
ncbi:hypothetical protein [Mucilaginibacter sp.]|uniref:hypothetical protein n=1 Tax=Mucilaginibacter sp. TaxID=1882438 RepID=UPI003AFF780F